MKYETPEAMFRAHFDDMIETFSGDGNTIINYILTLLVSILFTIREKNSEQVIEDLQYLFRVTQHGIDSRAFRTETLQ